MKELYQLLYSTKLQFVEKVVTGLQRYNTSPASGFSVSFNEETSPYYTKEGEGYVHWFSDLLQWLWTGLKG